MYSSYTALLIAGILVGLCVTKAPETGADPATYLINVTVRPGYQFPSAAEALASGEHICTEITAGHGYPELMQDVAAGLGTADQYQTSYLIAQAVNELCPASIWTLRNSAAHYYPKTA